MKERVDFIETVIERVILAESDFCFEIERHSGDRWENHFVASVNRERKERSFKYRWYRVCLFHSPLSITRAGFYFSTTNLLK